MNRLPHISLRWLGLAVVTVIAAGSVGFYFGRAGGSQLPLKPSATASIEAKEPGAPHVVHLPANATGGSRIQTETVALATLHSSIKTTGTIEANKSRARILTALTSGRVETVNADIGDRVGAGQVVATIVSSDVAELQGKLDEALARRDVASRELHRVRAAENRSAVITAKAKMSEADQTLSRTRALADAGIAPQKDVIAAETVAIGARADYDFQRSISLNREISKADGDLRQANAEVQHLSGSLAVLGADHNGEHAGIDGGRVVLRSPIEGVVTERAVNPGVGIESGKPLVTIADPRGIWVVANVASAQLSSIAIGDFAEIQGRDGAAVRGRVSYIDPTLDSQTHTGRVRVDVLDGAVRYRVGDFVTVALIGTAQSKRGITVPSEAVARDGDRTFVFVVSTGAYAARTVELGEENRGRAQVLAGLRSGERIATTGIFALKTALLRDTLGGGD